MSSISLIDCAKWYKSKSHQRKAIVWLQASTGVEKQQHFAKLYRNSEDDSAIGFENCLVYFQGLEHQVAALQWLEANTVPGALSEFARLWRTPEFPTLITLDDLVDMAEVKAGARSRFQPFVEPLNQNMEKFGVTSYLERCHFLAQLFHESGEFQFVEEIASGAAYEWRDDLGNVKLGDGVRFKGRGLIQLTGRSNYEQASRDLNIDFVGNPSLAAQLSHCVTIAFWFWNSRGLNSPADRDNVIEVTRRINGGRNGLDDRIKYLGRAKATIGR